MRNFNKKVISLLVLALVISFVIGTNFITPSVAATGSFNVLTYNIHGLWYPGMPDRTSQITLIGQKLAPYDMVNVQEDFWYHSTLYDQGDSLANHPYRTSSSSGYSGEAGGCNLLSKFQFNDTDRENWTAFSGIFDDGTDFLVTKGFMYNQTQVAPGVYVDVYNLHAEAGDDYAARQANLVQLANYINTYSQGHAVIVFGDTNCRYTRSEDNLKALLLDPTGLSDVWVNTIRGGVYPTMGSTPLLGTPGSTSPDNEVVDKIFYRSGAAITLTPNSYHLEDTYFTDASGNQLSDHYGATTNFTYTTSPTLSYSSTLWGGPGGIAFNFLGNQAPSVSRPTDIGIRTGTRVDKISMLYANGTRLEVGTDGGTWKNLHLEANEYITSAEIHKGLKNNTFRVFYVKFTTNLGHQISGGTYQTDATRRVTLTAPAGTYIAGFFGRGQTEVDKLGAIYRTLPQP